MVSLFPGHPLIFIGFGPEDPGVCLVEVSEVGCPSPTCLCPPRAEDFGGLRRWPFCISVIKKKDIPTQCEGQSWGDHKWNLLFRAPRDSAVMASTLLWQNIYFLGTAMRREHKPHRALLTAPSPRGLSQVTAGWAYFKTQDEAGSW